jgi:hypothetical protein
MEDTLNALTHAFVGVFGIHGLAVCLLLASCQTDEPDLARQFMRFSAIANAMRPWTDVAVGTEYRVITMMRSHFEDHGTTFQFV